MSCKLVVIAGKFIVWCFIGLLSMVELFENTTTMLYYILSMFHSKKSFNEHMDIHNFLFTDTIYQLLDMHKTQLFLILLLQYYFFKKTIGVYIHFYRKLKEVFFFLKNFRLVKISNFFVEQLDKGYSIINCIKTNIFSNFNGSFYLELLKKKIYLIKTFILALKKQCLVVCKYVSKKITNDPIFIYLKNHDRFKSLCIYIEPKLHNFNVYLNKKKTSIFSIIEFFKNPVTFLKKNKTIVLCNIQYFNVVKHLNGFFNQNKNIVYMVPKINGLKKYCTSIKKTLTLVFYYIRKLTVLIKERKGLVKKIVFTLIIFRMIAFFFININFYYIND